MNKNRIPNSIELSITQNRKQELNNEEKQKTLKTGTK